MRRLRTLAAVVALSALAAACGATPPPAAPAPDDPSLSATLDRADRVADQLNQREAGLESMLQDMDP